MVIIYLFNPVGQNYKGAVKPLIYSCGGSLFGSTSLGSS